MSSNKQTHSGAWIAFTYANMIAALALTLVGVVFLPVEIYMKGYFLMGILMLVSTTVILTKTLRDVEESQKLASKIEDARTEQLLAGIKA
jgi:hypothetical protein